MKSLMKIYTEASLYIGFGRLYTRMSLVSLLCVLCALCGQKLNVYDSKETV